MIYFSYKPYFASTSKYSIIVIYIYRILGILFLGLTLSRGISGTANGEPDILRLT